MRRVLPRRMGWVLVILMSGVGIPTNASIPAPIGDRLGVRRALDSTLTGPPPIVHRLLGKARFGVMMTACRQSCVVEAEFPLERGAVCVPYEGGQRVVGSNSIKTTLSMTEA